MDDKGNLLMNIHHTPGENFDDNLNDKHEEQKHPPAALSPPTDDKISRLVPNVILLL